ncbi:hypothetical protein [Halomontanus rarus]|nr:hypothetical protein [Halovivax sp. TS33]
MVSHLPRRSITLELTFSVAEFARPMGPMGPIGVPFAIAVRAARVE